MKIGIDARFFGLPNGFGRYSSELLHHLFEFDSKNDYVVFVRTGQIFMPVPKNVKVRYVSIQWYGWLEQLLWPLILYKEKLDIVHFLHFNIPLLYFKKFVVTIHDVLLLRFDSAQMTTRSLLHYRMKRFAYRLTLSHAVAHSSLIIAVSKFTKSEIISFFPTAEKKIRVIYEGSPFGSPHNLKKKPCEVPPEYFLYAGSCYPHKNVKFLIDEFFKWSKNHKNTNLVLVGQRDIFYERLRLYSIQNEFRRVHFLGPLPYDKLNYVFANAALYLSATLYEGFVLPQLEAMAFGVPVLVSDIPVMRETLGHSASYFSLNDSNSFQDALTTIYASVSLRTELTARGLEQVKKYRWKTMAAEIADLYQNV